MMMSATVWSWALTESMNVYIDDKYDEMFVVTCDALEFVSDHDFSSSGNSICMWSAYKKVLKY